MNYKIVLFLLFYATIAVVSSYAALVERIMSPDRLMHFNKEIIVRVDGLTAVYDTIQQSLLLYNDRRSCVASFFMPYGTFYCLGNFYFQGTRVIEKRMQRLSPMPKVSVKTAQVFDQFYKHSHKATQAFSYKPSGLLVPIMADPTNMADSTNKVFFKRKEKDDDYVDSLLKGAKKQFEKDVEGGAADILKELLKRAARSRCSIM